MVDANQIQEWLSKGTISDAQAKMMLADSIEYSKDRGSNKLVTALSTLGAVLLGVGAIMFVASNWQVMPNLMKTALLLISTFGSYWIGWYFKYDRQNLPRVGGALIFLGALLFGATIFLLAQMYNVNANSHILVIIWFVGILPFVYGFASPAIAGLSALLFYIWIGLFVFQGIEYYQAEGDFLQLPVLYLISGVLMFGYGAMHYFSVAHKAVARIYRLAGIRVAMLSLFLLTFQLFSGVNSLGYYGYSEAIITSAQFTIGLSIVAFLAIILNLISLIWNPSQSETNVFENLVTLLLTAVALIFFFVPSATNVYVLVFNLLLVAIVLVLITLGYRREDLKLINSGMFWISALIMARYFDYLWGMLPTSLFFIIGGAILIFGGMILETKRRQIKAGFMQSAVMTQVSASVIQPPKSEVNQV